MEDGIRGLRAHFKKFGLSVIRMVSGPPRGRAADVIAKQIIRSGTSSGANYHAACRARSKAEFIAELGIVEQELDETLHWLEMLTEAGLLAGEEAALLTREGNELLGITVSSIRTAKRRGPR